MQETLLTNQKPSRETRSEDAKRREQDAPLFRREVLAERQTQWLGTVLLEPRLSASFFTLVAGLAALGVIAFLFFGTFTRKARINGWLVPEQGLARIFAPRAGVVTRIYVKEGAEVAAGTQLLSLSGEIRSEAVGATRGEVIRRLSARRDSTTAQKKVQERLFDQKRLDLNQRLDALKREQRHLMQRMKIQRAQIEVAKKALDMERHLRKRELIPVVRLHRTEQNHLEQTEQLAALQQSRETLQRQLMTLKGQLRELPMLRETTMADLDRKVAALQQDLAEAEALRQIVLVAPHAGTVTAIQAEAGGTVAPAVPLMSIVPRGAKLQAELFAPSRAIGFVRPGQRVRLRFQPYPYQKFGSHVGIVASISHSSVSPTQLDPRLQGLASLHGSQEPVYRVAVKLERQVVTAYGRSVPLKTGMQLDADVMIETRRLFEWVLDPLYTLSGKMNE